MDYLTDDLRALRRWFRAADGEVRNAWLLTVTLGVALVCGIETVSGLTSDLWGPGHALAAFAFCGALCLAAWRPVSGGLLTVMWWMMLCVTPVAMPSSMLVGVLLCVGVLGYARKGLAVVVAVCAVAVWAVSRGGVTLGGYGSATSSPTIGGQGVHVLGAVRFDGVAPVAALFVGFLIGGVAARWGHDRDMVEARLRMRRQREGAARTIHDYVSNDLAYMILRLDQDIASGRAVDAAGLGELRAVAAKALGHTHEVIALIEGPDGLERAGTGRPGGADADDDEAAGLRALCDRHEARLRTLGFDGQTIVTVHPDARLGLLRRELIGDLLEELYGNIGKHADPSGGYVVTVRVGIDGVDIAVADTAAAGASDPGLSAGTGLRRCRERVERLGGTLRVTAGDDGEWLMAVTVPVSGAPDASAAAGASAEGTADVAQ